MSGVISYKFQGTEDFRKIIAKILAEFTKNSYICNKLQKNDIRQQNLRHNYRVKFS